MQQFREFEERSGKHLSFAPGSSAGAIFEGCNGEHEEVTIKKYTGACQPQHRNNRRYVPVLANPSPQGIYGVDLLKRQHDLIQQDYNETLDGALKLEVTIGRNYFFDDPFEIKTNVKKLYDVMDKTCEHMLKENAQGKKASRPRLFRSSFVNANLREENIREYVMTQGWPAMELEETLVYFDMKGINSNNKNLAIVFDGDLRFREFRTSEMKWLHMGYYRSDLEKQDLRIHLLSMKAESNKAKIDEWFQQVVSMDPLQKLDKNRICVRDLPPSDNYELGFVRQNKVKRYKSPNHGSKLIHKFFIDIIDVVRFYNPVSNTPTTGKLSQEFALQFDHESFDVLECVSDPTFLSSLTSMVDEIVI